MSNYDAWKLDNAEDAEARRVRAMRLMCDDCDRAYATVQVEDLTGYLSHDTYLCDRCADKRLDQGDPS